MKNAILLILAIIVSCGFSSCEHLRPVKVSACYEGACVGLELPAGAIVKDSGK